MLPVTNVVPSAYSKLVAFVPPIFTPISQFSRSQFLRTYSVFKLIDLNTDYVSERIHQVKNTPKESGQQSRYPRYNPRNSNTKTFRILYSKHLIFAMCSLILRPFLKPACSVAVLLSPRMVPAFYVILLVVVVRLIVSRFYSFSILLHHCFYTVQ